MQINALSVRKGWLLLKVMNSSENNEKIIIFDIKNESVLPHGGKNSCVVTSRKSNKRCKDVYFTYREKIIHAAIKAIYKESLLDYQNKRRYINALSVFNTLDWQTVGLHIK